MKGMSKLLEWQTSKYILLQIIIFLTLENITQ